MNPNQALWEKGDFTRIAETMRASGTAFVGSLGIEKGLDVLDLGCGDGTTAIPAARLGANVLGVDIARNLVEAGHERARAEGLGNCRFREGDASDLRDLADDSFDLVVSVFGAMFAPRPQDADSDEAGHWVRGKPITHSERSRSPDPSDGEHRPGRSVATLVGISSPTAARPSSSIGSSSSILPSA